MATEELKKFTVEPVAAAGNAVLAKINGDLFIGIGTIHTEIHRLLGYTPRKIKRTKEASDAK